MKYLVISCFLISLFSCSSYPKKNGFKEVYPVKGFLQNTHFSTESTVYTYRANITAYSKELTGILIIKKIKDSNHRVVFTTEIGNKLFDFSFSENEFKINHIIKELDKALLINVLKNDFGNLIKEHPLVTNYYTKGNNKLYKTTNGSKKYYYHVNQEVTKIVRVKKSKEKVIYLFSEDQDSMLKNIYIKHNNIKLTIKLKAI